MTSGQKPTSDDAVSPQEAAFGAQIQRDLRWNFAVNVADGAFFWLGLSFAAPSTIMPLYVSHLTDSRLLIGLVSAIVGAGWYLPQLLTAPYVEQLPIKKKMVIGVGLFSERLPFVVMAASVFLFAARLPGPALLLFFLTLTWHTLGAGAIAVAWQDMVAKVIPVRYRGRLLGVANALGTAVGMVGAATGSIILARYPFPTNFGICLSLLALFILASWAALALTREPPLQSSKPALSLRQYAQRLPGVLRSDRNFAAYLVTRIVATFAKMGIGFVTVYSVQRWNLSDSRAGFFTTMLLAGETVAYLGAGELGDRKGYKLVLELSLALLAFAMLTAVLAPSPSWMYLCFAAIGMLIAADLLSGIAIAMEFTTADNRPTYIGLANTVPGLFSAVAPLIGGWIASKTGYSGLFLTATALSLVAWATLHWWVREPRKIAFTPPQSR